MDDLTLLLAERDCGRLIAEYCRRVDSGHAAGIADLFCEDGTWEGVELRLTGRDEIRDWFVRRQALARRVSRHVCTNILIDLISPDEARSVCYMINYRHDRREGDEALPVPAEVPKFVGELHDTFRRTPEGWRFASRRVEVVFVRRRAAQSG
ncbi:MAG TPA: nuclear transport factor 2 family protein [Solirubrobacteraceae bacterium]|nr:nuclear transport factor 2 family protein [Solirubrobacteraceae bacterium]